MAPPTRLRPHLDDLLQKNLELEHVVADLRHQLTQSSAKWADERKTLAVGCDALMASFAKFRARLDVHPSDWVDSEGEVEQNLDAGRQSEETGEVDSGMLETETDQRSSGAKDVHERCRVLAGELRVKEEELEESRRKHEAAEVELQRIQGLLDAQSEQLRTALASANADTGNKLSPERIVPDSDTSVQVNPNTGSESTFEKLDLANQEISRLKRMLQEWKKYGSDWKRDGQMAWVRASELQLREEELSAQLKAAEESKVLLNTEIQRLTGVLADQTEAVEHQCTACQGSVKRVHDLEAMVALLRARLSPEELAAFDAEQNQATPGPSGLAQSLTPHMDANANKRGDMIMLKIPYRGANKLMRKPSTENNVSQDEQQNVVASSHQVFASQSMRVSPAPQKGNSPPAYNPMEYEVCIHTCNTLPCRNDSRSFLWPRRQPSLPRHVLSTKKHHRCSPDCPGYRLLNMPLAEAMKEPRRAKCRPPTQAELTLAAEEAKTMPPSERKTRKGSKVEGTIRSDGSGEAEEPEEPEGGSAREEEAHEKGKERSPRIIALSDSVLGKRPRTRTADGEESQRSRKLRSRISINAKS